MQVAEAKHSIAVTPNSSILKDYRRVRQRSEELCTALTPEDCAVQSMPDASPSKWHLAHTTWFFEQFILAEYQKPYQPYHPQFDYLFNSYYISKGERHARPQRGLLSRPSLSEIIHYRYEIDCRIASWLGDFERIPARISQLMTLGLNHEQQHQELLLMDIKHMFSCNPLLPAYSDETFPHNPAPAQSGWTLHEGGLVAIGQVAAEAAHENFCYDNETPRHKCWLDAFELGKNLVSNRDWLDFINDGGYRNPLLWLSEAWEWRQQNDICQPLYWQARDKGWQEFTLYGLQPLALDRPVCHISYFEAAAFANWAGARLPTEAEWEIAAQINETNSGLHPARCDAAYFGELWQWTSSAYQAYPGFKPLAGSLGEYNGKFMSSQMVLRGSACITPAGHSRSSYRNFFYPHMRWQFAGLRIARDA
ncbi:MAG: ergothioneine biosynthesis protein EgtB [Paracoccaceae bacterium]|jgi:ergothioneine biosynthesis protein EgtB